MNPPRVTWVSGRERNLVARKAASVEGKMKGFKVAGFSIALVWKFKAAVSQSFLVSKLSLFKFLERSPMKDYMNVLRGHGIGTAQLKFRWKNRKVAAISPSVVRCGVEWLTMCNVVVIIKRFRELSLACVRQVHWMRIPRS
jgi:hypothetical protein